ncbi:MAG: DUF1302 family protein [Candidatus Thiodiazotropha endolucinida]
MNKLISRGGSAAIASTLAFTSMTVSAFEVGSLTVNGYLRQYISVNLEDQPETTDDDAWETQMLRTSLFLDATLPTGQLNWTGRFRFSKDVQTDYEDDLENLTDLGGGFNKADFKDEYDETELKDVTRELFFDWEVNDRLSLRVGKQQVVWGETDFFHATDVIHGYDFRWRSFLVPENQDVRKPLGLIVANLLVPEASGELQLVYRPGWDDDDDVGNHIPAFGGRWSLNRNKGFNLIGSAPFDYHHEEGDVDDAHYGARWSGSLGEDDAVNYSVSYYHGQTGFQQDPILVCSDQSAFGTAACTGPFNGLAFILPETDTIGASASGYMAGIDTVWRAEFAYSPDRPLGTAFGEIVEIDAWNFVFGIDKTLRLQNALGTSSPSLFTVQVFDWYLPDVDDEPTAAAGGDVVMNFIGSGKYDEHNVIASAILNLPYAGDRWTVSLVGLADLTNGGGAFIPAVEWAPGPKWRIKLEADIFFGGDTQTPGGFPPDASVFGAFENMDQLLLRASYQF